MEIVLDTTMRKYAEVIVFFIYLYVNYIELFFLSNILVTHDIAEILLKVALNTKDQNQSIEHFEPMQWFSKDDEEDDNPIWSDYLHTTAMMLPNLSI